MYHYKDGMAKGKAPKRLTRDEFVLEEIRIAWIVPNVFMDLLFIGFGGFIQRFAQIKKSDPMWMI